MTAVARIAAEAVQNAMDTRATGSQTTAKMKALNDHTSALSKGFRCRRKRTIRKTMAAANTMTAMRGIGKGTDKPRTRVDAPQNTIRVRDWTNRNKATGPTDCTEKARSCINAISAKLMGTRTAMAFRAAGI